MSYPPQGQRKMHSFFFSQKPPKKGFWHRDIFSPSLSGRWRPSSVHTPFGRQVSVKSPLHHGRRFYNFLGCKWGDFFPFLFRGWWKFIFSGNWKPLHPFRSCVFFFSNLDHKIASAIHRRSDLAVSVLLPFPVISGIAFSAAASPSSFF